MNFKRIITAAALSAIMFCGASAQERLTREDYIQKYQALAIEQMEIYGIPASIKMAQALFESDNGNSRLARDANNHFGIKCKSSWTGPTITHTDDAPDECFRRYESVEASFLDHSEFLDKSPRYEALFKLDPLDYKGWAVGLKQAGYATNPNYPERIIKIIEDNQLFLLDQGQTISVAVMPPPADDTPEQPAQEPEQKVDREIIDVDNFAISVYGGNSGHTVYSNNGSEFVVASNGDTYSSIASEYGLTPKKIFIFNDVTGDRALKEGEMVYIKIKGKQSLNGKLIHVAKDGETMHSISQLYGIRLKNLCNINRRPKDSVIKSGQQIRLM